MENLNLALVSSSSPPLKLYLLGCNHPNYTPKNPFKTLPFPSSNLAPRRSRISIFAHSHSQPTPPRRLPHIVLRKLGDERFASISSSSSQQTSSVGVNPNPTVPPPSSQIGSPLFWIGVGVGLSALFTWVSTKVASSLKFGSSIGYCNEAMKTDYGKMNSCMGPHRVGGLDFGVDDKVVVNGIMDPGYKIASQQKYAMQQAFKTMMGQMNTQNNQFSNAAFPLGSPFPFPAPPSPGPVTSPSPSSQTAVTVDVPATKVEAAPATAPATEVKSETETAEPKKYAFVDVSPEETVQKSAFEDAAGISSSNNTQFPKDVSDNGAASKQDAGAFGGSQSTVKLNKHPIALAGSADPALSVDALEKMMEDPTVQKMVYPYLPEEMRNPETFKWMLQNPQYRQQLQDMLNNMGGSTEWDNRMMDSLKNFDLNSPDVKQQFVSRWSVSVVLECSLVPEEGSYISLSPFADQIGLTPEEVISKIMANPEVAMAFQNPRVQAAIMDCSQNPLSIAKYQNDKEVMDVFNKISELFPGVTGSP
ncbi:Hydroxyproline-rich glycoprotein family protein isoform 1 [Theobroma cacao]|uniref:Protein TIC 40, chloroplastic n=1 Tax=Theobroma cacao TaxID=3641 RepID=A0A061EGX0_THECC|nr:Hydroxyproline-rich glycoprotein family protein isoform 1 [Theobroma cacao]